VRELSATSVGDWYSKTEYEQGIDLANSARCLAIAVRKLKSELRLFALIHAGMGDNDQAFHLLDKASEERFNRLAYLSVESLWDPLRSELLLRIAIPELKLFKC
jgi:hypothetical protein